MAAKPPLTPEQIAEKKRKAEEAEKKRQEALAELSAQIPVDAVPGFSVASSTVTPESPWVKKMKSFSDEMKTNAYSYYNFDVRQKRAVQRMTNKIISADGFPPWVNVTYAYPPPCSFYTPNEDRSTPNRKTTVKRIVLHSFGHMWMASMSPKSKQWVGWFNSSDEGRGVQEYQLAGKTVYVAKGSDPENLAHFTRFSAGLRSLLKTDETATAPFVIDRAGNLTVVGSCNDVFFTDNCGSSGLGIEMEEAFYVVDPPSKNKPATFYSGGDPPGTKGNVKYLAYSTQQMLTLAILCRKLELGFPEITRDVVQVRHGTNNDSPPGYTCHDWIEDSKHFDVSPHGFFTDELWDAFFKLIDAQTHISLQAGNVWRPKQKYKDTSITSIVSQPITLGPTNSNFTAAILQNAQDMGLGAARAFDKANDDRASTNEEAGKDAVNEACRVSEKAANMDSGSQMIENRCVSTPGEPQDLSGEIIVDEGDEEVMVDELDEGVYGGSGEDWGVGL